MIVRHAWSATAAALVFALLGCTRDAAPPSPRAEGKVMTPAAGSAMPERLPMHGRCLENFRAFDDDGDGRVSQDEFYARPHADPDPAAVFRSRDRNADAALTEEEFCSGWHRGAAAPGTPGRGFGPGMGPGPKSGMGMHRRRMGGSAKGMRCEQRFETFDADGDRKVTREEFAAWPHARGDAQRLFAERDRNNDGSITRDEFCAPWK
jgi:Ca2+-binding EF-hand superfamily protein